MSGAIWYILFYGVIAVFLAVLTYRIFSISRLPLHLRWELAPVPHEKGKGQYGGSYLEDFEWWKHRRHKSWLAPLVYMAKEIFLLKGIWNHNRALWPLSLAFHIGLYLVIIMLAVSFITAVIMGIAVPEYVFKTFLSIISVTALSGYFLGSAGSLSLLLKRVFDPGLRLYNTLPTYFKLVFLGSVFISGAWAWFTPGDFALTMSELVRSLITLDSGISLSLPFAIHIILAWLFILYLPFTNMIHFAVKHFLYHGIRWNDTPQDEKIANKVHGLLNQPVSWSAPHIVSGGRQNWTQVASGEKNDKEAP